jgi:hypothetical protein
VWDSTLVGTPHPHNCAALGSPEQRVRMVASFLRPGKAALVRTRRSRVRCGPPAPGPVAHLFIGAVTQQIRMTRHGLPRGTFRISAASIPRHGAGGGIRTHMVLRPGLFKSPASASFATPAPECTQTKGCDTSPSRSRCSLDSRTSSALRLSSSCSGCDAPTMGDVTSGWASSHATATAAALAPTS